MASSQTYVHSQPVKLASKLWTAKLSLHQHLAGVRWVFITGSPAEVPWFVNTAGHTSNGLMTSHSVPEKESSVPLSGIWTQACQTKLGIWPRHLKSQTYEHDSQSPQTGEVMKFDIHAGPCTVLIFWLFQWNTLPTHWLPETQCFPK